MSSHGLKWHTNPTLALSLPASLRSREGERDLDWVRAAREWLDRLLSSPSVSFWSTLIHNKETMKLYDDVIEYLPRPYEEDRWNSLASSIPSFLEAERLLRGSALAFFLRIAVHDQQDGGIPCSAWAEFTRVVGVLRLERVASSIVCFAPPTEGSAKSPGLNVAALAKVLQSMVAAEPRISEDFIALEERQLKELATMRADAERLARAWPTARGARRVAVASCASRLAAAAVDWVYSAAAFYAVTGAAKLKTRPVNLIAGIAAMTEAMRKLLTTETVQDMAITLDGYPIRHLLRLRTQLLVFAVELCQSLLKTYGNSEGKRAESVRHIIQHEEFCTAFNRRYCVARELPPSSSTAEKQQTERVLGVARERTTEATLADLERLGMLDNLGNVSTLPPDVASGIDEILQILPHLAPAFVHLCLRHTSYNVEEAVDIIMSGRVPGWLAGFEAAGPEALQATGKRGPRLPPLGIDYDDSHISDLLVGSSKEVEGGEEKEREEPDSKNLFKGIFSLAPTPAKKTAESAEEADRVMKAAATTAIREIRDALARAELRSAGVVVAEREEGGQAGHFGTETQRLVEMKTAKKYAGAEKFKTTAADKVAVRPFYEKYKYAMEDDDMYNDEFDDAYADLPTFSKEAKGPDELSSPEDEEEKKKPEMFPPAGRDERSDGNHNRKTTFVRGGGGQGAEREAYQGRGSGEKRGGQGRESVEERDGGGGESGGQRETQASEGGGTHQQSRSGYTGGRERQLNERHKNKFRQRGADRKMKNAGGL